MVVIVGRHIFSISSWFYEIIVAIHLKTTGNKEVSGYNQMLGSDFRIYKLLKTTKESQICLYLE